MKKAFWLIILLVSSISSFSQDIIYIPGNINSGDFSVENICYVTGRSDLFMRDDIWDCGDEPYVTTSPYWKSEDIWIEDMNENVVSSLEANVHYYFCARVINRGNMVSNEDDVIHLHWRKANVGGGWPYGWFADYPLTCDGQDVIVGMEITPEEGISIPQIEPDNYLIIKYEWVAPNPAVFEPCAYFESNPSDRSHYCIMARIEEPSYGDYTDMSTQNTEDAVFNSNNIVSRNISIIMHDGTSPAFDEVDLNPEVSHCKLVGQIMPEIWDGSYQLFFHLDDYLTIECDNSYNYGNTVGIQPIQRNGWYEVTQPHFEILDLNLDPYTPYAMEFELVPVTFVDYDIIVDLVLYDMDTNKKAGGNQIEFRYNSGATPNYIREIRSNPAIEQTINEDSDRQLDYTNYTVYSIDGQLICSGSDKTLQSLPQGIYVVYATNNDKIIINKIIK